MSSIGLAEIPVIVGACLVAIVFVVVPYWRIFKRAGFAAALSLLMLIPFVNVALLYWFAFAEWPSLRRGETAGHVNSSVS